MKNETGWTIFLGCAALACFVLSASMQGWTGVFFVCVGIWLAAWAGIMTLDQVGVRWVDFQDYLNGVRTHTVDVRKLELLQKFDPKQMEAMGGYLPFIKAIGGSHGPLLGLTVLKDESVALDYVFAFLAACTDDELLPIRAAQQKLNQFSNARLQAEQLTDYFIWCGFAVPGAGPNQAKWVDDGYARACTWCGYGTIQIGWEDEVPANRMVIRRTVSSKHAEATE